MPLRQPKRGRLWLNDGSCVRLSTDAQPVQAAEAAALLAERTEIWRLPVVQKRTGLSTSEIYARMAEDTFPLAIKLGERAIAWHAGEVLDWIAARPRWAPGIEAPGLRKRRLTASSRTRAAQVGDAAQSSQLGVDKS